MAIKIKLTGGVDFGKYLDDFDANFEAGSFGFFSEGLGGDEYAVSSDPSAELPITGGTSVIVDSGDAGDLEYDFATHTIQGFADSVQFGAGLVDDGGGDYSNAAAILISGLNLSGEGPGNDVSELVGGILDGDTSFLRSLLEGSDLNLKGSAENDKFAGFDGDDKLKGGAGNDKLDGDDGKDKITGATGNDKLTGGDGNDTFIFGKNSGNDKITDFDAGPGKGDVLDLGKKFDSFADVLDSATQKGDHVVITFDDSSKVTLQNVDLGDLHKSDFLLG